jgi:DNA polymerase-4
VLEPSGYGHAYMDITGTGRLFGPPRDMAWRAQKEIRQRLRLDASLGVAANKMVSRIASKITRPAGLQDVPHGDEPSFLSPLPVDLLPGVGARTQEQLEDLNIRIIRDLALMRQEHLTLVFGRFGFVLHQRALGIDDTPVYTVRTAPAVVREQTLTEDSNDYELLKSVLFELCERAGEQLRTEKQRAGRMELRIRYSDFREESGKTRLAHSTQSTGTLCSQATLLLERNLTRRTRVRSLQLRLSDLACGSVQLELFADRKLEKQAKLESALDALRHRYGASVLARGQIREIRDATLLAGYDRRNLNQANRVASLISRACL